MRIRSGVAVAVIGLLSGAAQVDAHGGGFHGGAMLAGGRAHFAGPPPMMHAPPSIGLAPSHDGPFYTAAPADRRGDDGARHDFRRDGDFRHDGDFRRDRDRFDGSGHRIGFPGGAIDFAPRPPSHATPVLYNYYYAAGDNYYSNVVSSYGVPADPCPACAR